MERIRVTGLRGDEDLPARILFEQGQDIILVDEGGFDDFETRLALATRTLGWLPKNPMATVGGMAKLIVNALKAYAKGGIEESVRRNSHMNAVKADAAFDVASAEAALVDFVNNLMARQGCDLGLYTIDLHQTPSEKPK